MLIWYADVSDMTEEQMKKYLEELSEYRLEKVNRFDMRRIRNCRLLREFCLTGR